jgi:hypothetical protein
MKEALASKVTQTDDTQIKIQDPTKTGKMGKGAACREEIKDCNIMGKFPLL